MRTKKDTQGLMLIGGVVLAGLLLLAAKVATGGGQKPGADNCVGTPTASTVIVLDQSESVTDQTVAEMRARAWRFVEDSVRSNERVSVFTVNDLSKHSLKPLFSACKPPNEANRLFENVKAVHKRFREGFQIPLDSALQVSPGNTKESPLAQALTDISLSQYLRAERNALLVFSDMLENTDRFRLYGCSSPGEIVSQFRASRVGATERPTFKNTKVYLHIVPRLDIARTTLQCRDSLWVWFFGDNAGDSAGLELDYLPGGQPTAASLRGAAQ